MKRFFILLVLLVFVSLNSFAQNEVIGKWKTIDDNTGKPRAVVEIFERNGKLFGKIVKLFRSADEDQDPTCDKCTGKDKDQKIIGLEIIRDMVQDDDAWEDGTILDAEDGKTYTCKLWLEDGKLKVRGYIAFFYRTQEWQPY